MKSSFFTFIVIGLISVVMVGSAAWAAEPNTIELQLPTEKEMVLEKAVFSSDGSKVAIFCQEAEEDKRLKDQAILVYDFLHKRWIPGVERKQGFLWQLEPLALNRDGSLLAYRDGEDLVVLDLKTHQQLHKIEGVGSMSQATFDPAGGQLAFLMLAEWEIPTSLYVLDLQKGSQKKVVSYSGDTKASGPLHWDARGIFFVEEFTWGTINSHGLLKVFQPHKDQVLAIYELPWESSRVSDYYYSPDGVYRALVIREFDEDLETSEYGLLIQRNNQFVHGAKLAEWRDRTESYINTDLSFGGWVGNRQFYWVNRDQQVYNLYLYDIQKQEQTQYQFNQPILVTPYGEIIKLGR